jgi:DNA damage-inducible protein 1
MLYLDVEAEGRILRAFVDTGAQVTVMSAACAARCGLLSKVDKRFAGRAVGVGSAKILGRIHDAHLRCVAAAELLATAFPSSSVYNNYC